MSRNYANMVTSCCFIGRGESNSVRSHVASVSRKHAVLSYVYETGEWFVEDLGSFNGTMVVPKVGAPWRLVAGVQYLVGADDRIYFGAEFSLCPKSLWTRG